MGFIEDELQEVKKLCEQVVPGSKLVSCVLSMVRVEIKRTEFKKIIICMQFTEKYPNTPILLELKSKTLSDKLLQKLTDVCESETKKYLGKAQILNVIKFVRNFIEENPLSCCYDEISVLKKKLSDKDEFKLRQKASSIYLKVNNNGYYLTCKILIPDDYPTISVDLQDVVTNFSPIFNKHMICQAKELARRCVEAPLKKKPNEPPFQAKPSLQGSVQFLIDCVKRLPQENCQVCNQLCFPKDPNDLVSDENSPKHIERVYCGHLFHQECFFKFMKTPPFGNKKCTTCGHRIHHYKWSLSDKLAEDRWAHEQARERELEEVTEFFK
ncbi:unnamed protein product [Brassicogethes aeneus]|uniref:RWD domain-containing protein n=1 Tax=Brassicogethes aeneus TaxID=1431903 RepID=A0A9P0BCL3_BRAAE|nr:unnamed protein product [Brassicogethes aeneus]